MYIVIIGGGKIAEFLAMQMLKKGHDIAIIEKRQAIAQHLAEELPGRALIICGDGCDSAFQNDAGISHADVLVATTGNDDDNLVSCEIAKTVFKAPRTIARVNNPKNERIFRALGIEAVSSTSIISKFIEEEAFAGDMLMMSSLRKNNLVMIEIDVPKGNKFFGSRGRRLGDLVLPQGSLIMASAKNDNFETVTPDTMICAGDSLVALTKIGDEELLKDALHVK